MINIVKGNGLTLNQSDIAGNVKANEGVVAGMVCHIGIGGDAGKVLKGAAADRLVGFAVNNQSDGDVISSGKIGLLLLDGSSVIETDQAAATINSTNYVVGDVLYAETGNTGKVTTANTSGVVVGTVYGVRSIPNTSSADPIANPTVSVLAIKLAA
jgi:hypothetical protein